MRAVDEEDVDRAGNLLQRRIGEGAHVADPLGDAGAREVGVERLVVGTAAIGVGGDLLRPAIRAGVRIDAHDLDAGAGQHDRRAPAEGADLDHADHARTCPGQGHGRDSRRACASVSHPSTSRACAHASSKVTTPRPRDGAGGGR